MKAPKADAAVVAAVAGLALLAAAAPAAVRDAGRSWREAKEPPRAATPAPQGGRAATPALDPEALARRAVQRGLLELATQPDLWNRVEAGDPPPGLRFDERYRDAELPGSFAVSLASGPLFGQVTVTGVARVGGEVRGLRAVYDYFPRPELSEAACAWGDGAPRCP